MIMTKFYNNENTLCRISKRVLKGLLLFFNYFFVFVVPFRVVYLIR